MPAAAGSPILRSSGCTKLDDIESVSTLSESDELLRSLLTVSSLGFGKAELLCVDTREGALKPDGIDFPDLSCICAIPGLTCSKDEQISTSVSKVFPSFVGRLFPISQSRVCNPDIA